MVHVRSGHVVGDNLWLWRADHAVGGAVTLTGNACDNGLVIDGNDVTMCVCTYIDRVAVKEDGTRSYVSPLPDWQVWAGS